MQFSYFFLSLKLDYDVRWQGLFILFLLLSCFLNEWNGKIKFVFFFKKNAHRQAQAQTTMMLSKLAHCIEVEYFLRCRRLCGLFFFHLISLLCHYV